MLWLMAPETPSVDELVAQLISRPAWHRRAACRGMGTDAFFPNRGESSAAAVAVCEGCEVRSECLDAALERADTHGVWAGTSARGRRVLRRGAA